MGPRRRRSRRRARGQACPRTRRTTSPRPSPGPPPARCRPGGRRAGEIATRREAPTTTTTTSSRDRRPSPRHQTRPRTRSTRATRRTRGLAQRTRVHTPRPSSSGALVDPTSRPASARARANNLYGHLAPVVLPACSRTFVEEVVRIGFDERKIFPRRRFSRVPNSWGHAKYEGIKYYF